MPFLHSDDSTMKEIWALIYRTTAPQPEFEARIPRLMEWLRDLHAEGRLKGCGGGGWKDDSGGGLTLIEVSSEAEIEAIAARNPMNEIGTTEIMIWDVFFADLSVLDNAAKLIRN